MQFRWNRRGGPCAFRVLRFYGNFRSPISGPCTIDQRRLICHLPCPKRYGPSATLGSETGPAAIAIPVQPPYPGTARS